MKLNPDRKRYLYVLALSLFSFAFNSCRGDIIENIFGPERDDPIEITYELWTLKSDGSESSKIAEGGRLCSFLSGTNKILYLSSPSSTIGLNVINLDGSGQTLLWKDDYSDINSFSFSPGNSKILLPTVYHGLYELDPGTLDLYQILNAAHTPVAGASYSKSMNKIVCQDKFGITMLDRYGNNHTVDNVVTIRKFSDSVALRCPAFVFNDSQIIYLQRYRTWPSDVYSLRSYSLGTGADSELISYKSVPLLGEHLEVANENRIVCTVLENNKYYIKIIDLADNYRTVSLGEGKNFSLSPDRSKVIIYDKKNIYIANTDGTDRHMVFTELGDRMYILAASLSFDGKYIVFSKAIDIRRY